MSDEQHHPSSTASRPRPRSATWWLTASALVAGIIIGLIISNNNPVTATDLNADATATRTAELIELNDLRTQVAQPVICTPPPSPTATSTPQPTATATVVPAMTTGQEFNYRDKFSITITSIGDAGTPGSLTPNGRFLSVYLTMENVTSTGQRPPFNNWRLVSSDGRLYRLDISASQAVFGRAWGLPVGANASEQSGLVFDVPLDSGSVFILESDEDPTFRVELVFESRG